MHSFMHEFIYSPLTRQVSLTASCGLRPVQGAGETGRPFACPYGAMDTNPVAQTQAGLKRGKAGKEGNGMQRSAVGAGGRGGWGTWLRPGWQGGSLHLPVAPTCSFGALPPKAHPREPQWVPKALVLCSLECRIHSGWGHQPQGHVASSAPKAACLWKAPLCPAADSLVEMKPSQAMPGSHLQGQMGR